MFAQRTLTPPFLSLVCQHLFQPLVKSGCAQFNQSVEGIRSRSEVGQVLSQCFAKPLSLPGEKFIPIEARHL